MLELIVDYAGCLHSSFVSAHLVDFNVLLQPGGVHGADCEQLHQIPAEEPVGRVDGIQEPGLGEPSSKVCCRFYCRPSENENRENKETSKILQSNGATVSIVLTSG